jgi:hypothetical protein
VLACYAVLLVLVLLPSRTRAPPLLGQNVIDVYVLAYTALLALHVPPAVLVLVSLNRKHSLSSRRSAPDADAGAQHIRNV